MHLARPYTRPNAGNIVLLLLCILLVPMSVHAQEVRQSSRMIVPLRSFISVQPFEGAGYQQIARTISKDEIDRLTVVFQRENLSAESGPQFVRIRTQVLDRDGIEVDEVTQFAFTFPREATPDEDARQLEDYARQIRQFGFIAPGRSDSVEIELDSLPDWGYLRVEIVPDEEFTKYTSRNNARIVWHYRIQGNWLDSRFTLGIPKVLYDTEAQDTVDYGNASALLRFFYVNQNTGEQFPVSAGFGLYGVSTPLDVSSRGGGFVLSLYFDIIQFLRVNGLEITDKANAGLEIAPFFPVDRKARVLLSARIGYNP